MGSTYVVGKQAAACRDETGALFYLLSENSYESNVHPRTPHWSARFFGTYDDCIARVIRWSSSVEGGMLRGDAKTSTAYIKQWREKLSAPVLLEKEVLTAEFRGGVYDLPEAGRAPATELAANFGIEVPEGAALSIDMSKPGALRFLAQLVNGRIEGMLAWRFFRYPECRTLPRSDLGTPLPKSAHSDLGGISVHRVKGEGPGGDDDFVITSKGEARSTGWAYSTMQSFICVEAIEAEARQPGAAEPAIRAFRKIVQEALPLPATTQIAIRKPGGDVEGNLRWETEKFERLCAKLDVPQLQTVDVTFEDVQKSSSWSDVRYLSRELVSYRIPSPAVAAAPQLQLEA